MNAALDLGPATEARITEAFKKRLLLAAQDLTGLLGVNEKTLRLMREAGLIGCVQVGAGTFRYREQDVRAFLSSETPQAALKEEPPCPSTSQQSCWRGCLEGFAMKAGRITDREKPSPCDPPASRPRSARRGDVAGRALLRPLIASKLRAQLDCRMLLRPFLGA